MLWNFLPVIHLFLSFSLLSVKSLNFFDEALLDQHVLVETILDG